MIVMSIIKNNDKIKPHIDIGLEGTVKNNKATRMFPTVNVVKANWKNPEPRPFIICGLTKVEISSKIHHTKLMIRMTTEKYRRARTLQRL